MMRAERAITTAAGDRSARSPGVCVSHSRLADEEEETPWWFELVAVCSVESRKQRF
jgi:hypothetical protein